MSFAVAARPLTAVCRFVQSAVDARISVWTLVTVSPHGVVVSYHRLVAPSTVTHFPSRAPHRSLPRPPRLTIMRSTLFALALGIACVKANLITNVR